MKKTALMLWVVLLGYLLLACSGNSSDGNKGGDSGGDSATIELWHTVLTGSGEALQCAAADHGEFSENFTFTVQYPESLSADIAARTNSRSSNTVNGTGIYSGTESVARQPSSGICVLEPTVVDSASITAETFYTENDFVASGPQYATILRSDEILVGDRMYYPSTGDRADVPVYHMTLSGTTYSPSQISGIWRVSGSGSSSGNTASGSFVMSLLFSGNPENIQGPTGLSATPGSENIKLTWNPVAGAVRYTIRYAQGTSVPSSGYLEIMDIPPLSSSVYEVSSLTAGLQYTFVVVAVLTEQIQSQPSSPVTATPLEVFFASKIDAGFDHTCAILTNDTVQCWGGNAAGQLGADPTVTPTGSVNVPGIGNPIDIAAGHQFSCAIVGATPADTSGSVKCWGRGGTGQLGNNATADSAMPVSVSGLSAAIQISARAHHVCALLANGQVMCWGEGTAGQLGNNATTNSPVPVAAQSIGPDNYMITPAVTKAHQVSTGETHTCARVSTSNGSAGLGVKCWGATNHGELGNGAPFCQVGEICDPKGPNPKPQSVNGVTQAAHLAVGGHHSCVVLTTGGVRCWGQGNQGQLGNGQISHSNVPVTVSSLSGAANVSAGSEFSCASAGGVLSCWGMNNAGQLGNGGTAKTSTPIATTEVASGTFDPGSIQGGDQATCLIRNDSSAFCFP